MWFLLLHHNIIQVNFSRLPCYKNPNANCWVGWSSRLTYNPIIIAWLARSERLKSKEAQRLASSCKLFFGYIPIWNILGIYLQFEISFVYIFNLKYSLDMFPIWNANTGDWLPWLPVFLSFPYCSHVSPFTWHSIGSQFFIRRKVHMKCYLVTEMFKSRFNEKLLCK